MVKSRLTLIVDGNWLLMSRMFVLDKKFKTDADIVNEIKLMMIKSINVVLRTFTDIDNIIFVSDGGSWRKNLPIPSFLSSDEKIISEYKGTRTSDETINWDLVFEGYNQFVDELKSYGINAYHEHGIEGDDWVWYWSNKLNAEGTNCIIWSKDKDLTQLVKTNSDGCFVICWNKDNGATIENKAEDDMDFFFNTEYNINKQILSNIKKRSDFTYINPHDVIIDKVFRGDTSDNIMAVIKKKTKTDKEYKISAKDLDYSIDIYDDDQLYDFIDTIMNSKKYSGKVPHSRDEILEHIHYNTKLVVLDESSYPQEILQILKNEKSYNCNKDTKALTDRLTAQNNAVIDILETL